MIGHVMFKVMHSNTSYIVLPYEHYGILMINYDAPPPTPKTYRVPIEGRNGSIDMSAWAGDVFYDDRTITIRLRDMNGRALELENCLLGNLVHVCFDTDDPDFYYNGRVEKIDKKTRNHVTDMTLIITCDPFRYPVLADLYGYSPSLTGLPYSGYILLSATVNNDDDYTWTPTLYQNSAGLTLNVSGFSAENAQENNPSKITVNGHDTIISQNGYITVADMLHKGSNTITITNNQTGTGSITASIKFQNRVT